MEKLIRISVVQVLNYFFSIINSNAELVSELFRDLTREQQERFLCEVFIKKIILILNKTVGLKRVELSKDKTKLFLFIEITVDYRKDIKNKISNKIERKIAVFENIKFNLVDQEISFILKVNPDSKKKDIESYIKEIEGKHYILNKLSKERIEKLLSEKYWDRTIPKELYIGEGKLKYKEMKNMISDFIKVLVVHGVTNLRGETLNYLNTVMPNAEKVFPEFNDLSTNEKTRILKNACKIENLSKEENIDQYVLARVIVNEIIKENLHKNVIIEGTSYTLDNTYYNSNGTIKFFYYDYPGKGGVTLQHAFDPFVFCENITATTRMNTGSFA